MKVYFVLRRDLNMSPVEFAIACVKGVEALMLNNSSLLPEWLYTFDTSKVICEVEDFSALKTVREALSSLKVKSYRIMEGEPLVEEGLVFIIDEDFCSPEVKNYIDSLKIYRSTREMLKDSVEC